MEPKAPATPSSSAGSSEPAAPGTGETSPAIAAPRRESQRGNNQYPIPPWPSRDDDARHKRDEFGRLQFDLGVIKGLGQIGATAREIATVVGCAERTIAVRLRDEDDPVCLAYREGRAEIISTLRRKQIAVAMQGNVKMLTWLGMQLLDQKNVAKQTVESKAKIEQSFTFTIKQGSEEGEDGEEKRVVEMEQEPTEEPAEPRQVNGNGVHHPAANGEAIIITAPAK